ncbi:hypothetical protein MG296_12270, partial [Flavobacteriaceae bacterium TK19130]|nr:hypothetical protein [Thermobacterium salinum]
MKHIYNSPKHLILFLFLIFSATAYVNAQGTSCSEIEPFCAGSDGLIFPNCNNADPNCPNSAEPGPDYGCLFSQPYPAWFYLQIDQSGTLDFEIIQNTAFDANGDPIGTGLDVDFICWGPFNQGDDLCDYSQLQSFNEVACSYSAAPIENFTIPGATAGEIYVLVITNFNQSPGFISLVQTNAGASGAGSTDCSIVNTQTGCEGEDFVLDAEILGATNYLWEYDDGTGFVTIFDGNFPTITVNQGGTYRATITLASGTTDQREFIVEVYAQPEIDTPPNDIFICDDGVNSGIFDLTQNTPLVLGAQDPAEFAITYHNTQTDADNGTAPIGTPNAYPITGTSETIYVRIADSTGTCFATAEFEIEFLPVTIGTLTDIEECDTDSNGFEQFDLPVIKDTEALNGQDPLEYTVTYYGNSANANAGVNELPNPYTVNVPGATVFVRVERNDNATTCYIVDSFDIILNPQPVIASQPIDLFICDDGVNPGIFDLTQNTPIVLGTQDPADFNVSYHNTQTDADNGTAAIGTPNSYPIGGAVETIYIRIEDLSGNCFATANFEIEFSSVTTGIIDDFFVCDQDETGDETINLSALFDATALDGQDPLDYTVSYHGSQADADNDVNALTSPYNISVPSQTIFVRVEYNDNSNCFDTSVSFVITLDTPPVVNSTPSPLVFCDSDSDGFGEFFLHDADADITGGDPDLTVTYHGSLLNAE